MVFGQDDPAAVIQTPGGTIEPGEDVLAGALREAFEETGLDRFDEPRRLCFEIFEGPEGPVECHHLHLPVIGETMDAWSHTVSAGTEDAGMVFHCFWLTFGEARRWVWPTMLRGLDVIAASSTDRP